ncbi:MAG: putative capsid protein [Cressdnaviricota sp.]|nr:MAG: putative capsid protein [Cressdnaviricota sp.]
MPSMRKRKPRVARAGAYARSAYRTTTGGSSGQRRRRGGGYQSAANIASRVGALYSMIETKEGTISTNVNIALPHNNVYVLQSGGVDLNPFLIGYGSGDPMAGTGNRVGDRITVRGISLSLFLENALQRARVYYRIMLIKKAKGDTLDRSTLYKGDCNNKMLDQVNTERFKIVAQKIINVNCTNNAPVTVGVTGVPSGGTLAGISSKIVRFWIPGRKFGKNGNVQFENGSGGQCKYFDYRWVIVAYDWYGTPQDANNVGNINEAYAKVYFKDA